MDYNFSQLNDKEFEHLVNDLLAAKLQVTIERFKEGKDKGVDGRFYTTSEKEVIIQSKHYLKTGYPGLVQKLKREEKEKVSKLNPSRYIFVTSLPLSRDNKKEITEIFAPHIKESSDILGCEDLNDLISKYPQVEQKHYKLWLTSTNILKRITNNSIVGRSEYELQQILRNSQKYVFTKNHSDALDLLSKNKILIISGEPGIGKTTLAENLCVHFAANDYELVVIQESISEAESVIDPEKKQLFYFDDFLGSNYFEAIENKKDSHIIKFIERVRNAKNKLFILTSRTNILISGIAYSSIFATSKLNKSEFLLTLNNLTEIDKAHILYNHMWFSDLTEDLIEEIYKDKRYKDIIKHRNFNPRIIEFITDIDRIGNIETNNYWDYIIRTLDNPKDIWEICFKTQNNAYVRNLVLLTAYNNLPITEDKLKLAYNTINSLLSIQNSSHSEKDFISMSRLAIKVFLNRYNDGEDILYKLFNPSIGDYVLNEYTDPTIISAILQSLSSIESLRFLNSLKLNGKIQQRDINSILNSVINYELNNNRGGISYKLYLLTLGISELDRFHSEVVDFLTTLIKNPIRLNDFTSLIKLLDKFYDDIQIDDWSIILNFIDNRLDAQELQTIGNFLDEHGIDDEIIQDYLVNECEDFIQSNIDEFIDGLDLSEYVTINNYYHEGVYNSEVDYDDSDIYDGIYAYIESVMSDIKSDYIHELPYDISVYINSVRIDNLVQKYLARLSEHDYDEDRITYSESQQIDTVEEIFER